MSGALPIERVIPPGAARRRLRGRDPLLAGCVVVIAALVLMALLAPLIAPHDPDASDILAANEGSSLSHPLGTDSVGRDILSRIIHGARLSLLGPALVVVAATVGGVAVALVTAWRGGRVDTVASRVLDILFAFPGLIFAILAVAMFGTGLVAPVIALSIAYLPYIARVIRSAAIRERALPYVEACQVAGMSPLRICWRHLLPNLLPYVAVQAAVSFGYALVDLSALSYLGLGVQPPSAEWGRMVADGQAAILNGNPEASLYAGMAIVVTVLAFNLLADRLVRRTAQ
ncbi:MAG: ABC transporter permease [Thermoleophilaceae bacterium]|nr:ABC transporter permease [Thermoleophilaceae bacterium]